MLTQEEDPCIIINRRGREDAPARRSDSVDDLSIRWIEPDQFPGLGAHPHCALQTDHRRGKRDFSDFPDPLA